MENQSPINVSIVGTGNLSQALAKLHSLNNSNLNNFSLTLGSQNQQLLNQKFFDLTISPVNQALQHADVIILAIPSSRQFEFIQQNNQLFKIGSIIVDPSNDETDSDKFLQIQKIQSQNKITYVKAFNDLSVFQILDDHYLPQTNKKLSTNILGDDLTSLQVIKNFAETALGLNAIIHQNSRTSQFSVQRNQQVFPNWVGPSKFIALTFAATLSYASIRYNVYGKVKWQNFPLEVVNKALSWTGLTGLTVTFGAGVFMNLRHLVYGRKPYHHEAQSLKKALNRRKELGLLSLGCIGLHSIISLLIFSPAYYAKFFETATQSLTKLNQMGEWSMFLGISAYALTIITGLTSIPSIAEILGWKEWRFSQSILGWLGLLLGTLHVTVLGNASWFDTRKWQGNGGLPPITLLACIPPFIVLLLKLFTTIPPFSSRLDRINKGSQK